MLNIHFVDFAISFYNFIWMGGGESQNSLDKKHITAEEKYLRKK